MFPRARAWRPFNEVVAKPFEARHTGSELKQLADYLKSLGSETNDLIALLDQTCPCANALFNSPVREDGRQKWVDFAASFWHADYVRDMSQSAFVQRYARWCKQRGYQARTGRAAEIYEDSKDLIAMLPRDAMTKLLVKQTVDAINTVSKTLGRLKGR